VSAPGDYDNGEIGGMIGKGNRSTRRKPAPVPLCPPQTPHAARARTMQRYYFKVHRWFPKDAFTTSVCIVYVCVGACVYIYMYLLVKR
jgi:hypothetical protein